MFLKLAERAPSGLFNIIGGALWMPWFIQFPVCLLAAALLRGQLLTREVVKKGLEHMYVCVYLCMYIGYIYVDERPSFSCQNILSLNACIDPGRPATYTHMQSCDVEAEPLTQYLRPLSLAAAPSPIQRKRAIPRYRIRKREYRIQQKALSRAKLERVTYPSYWGRALGTYHGSIGRLALKCATPDQN